MQASSSGNYIAKETFKNSFVQQSLPKLEIRSIDFVGPTQMYGPFYRYGDSATAINNIKTSGELWGNAARNYMASSDPYVKAYASSIPATGKTKFEFFTDIKPYVNGNEKTQPIWRLGQQGVREVNDKAVIKCVVTRTWGC